MSRIIVAPICAKEERQTIEPKKKQKQKLVCIIMKCYVLEFMSCERVANKPLTRVLCKSIV